MRSETAITSYRYGNKIGCVKRIRTVAGAVLHPGHFARHRSQRARRLYHRIARLLHVRTYRRRCAGPGYATVVSGARAEIDPEIGFLAVPPGGLAAEQARAAVAEVRERVSKLDVDSLCANSRKSYLVNLLADEELGADSAIVRYVTSPEIVGVAAKYLRCVPLLTNIRVWYSPNDSDQPAGSQVFHIDHEDYRQMKGFLFIDDVTPESGPLTLLPARHAIPIQRQLRMTRSKQVSDEAIADLVPSEDVVSLTGPAGTLGLVDTSNCFHFGSRAGTRPRLVLTFQYLTPFAFTLPWLWQRGDLLRHLWPEARGMRAQLVGRAL